MSSVFRFSVSVSATFAAVLFMALLFSASPAWAQSTFTVNSTGDGADADTSDASCETAVDGECTLRAAIEQANAVDGTDAIEFGVDGDGPHTISPVSDLPTISESVVIDGYTQTGAATATANGAATLKIELDGSGGNAESGITIGADGGGSTVRGLVIGGFASDFSGYGIHILSDGNTVGGNHIGTSVAGDERADNGSGVLIENTSGNVIGGSTAADRNVISGNGMNGVWIFGTPTDSESATENVISGNYLGTDATGMKRLANGDPGEGFGGGGSGVRIMNASGNAIGGTESGARNIISGNGQFGVHIERTSSDNEVRGNYIGTNVSGTDAIPNEQDGVRIENSNANPLAVSSGNIIGGAEEGAGNVISGNNSQTSYFGSRISNGVYVRGPGTKENVISGNFIGTDKDGAEPLENTGGFGIISTGNGQHGVWVFQSSGNVVGGAEEGAGNVISGNEQVLFDGRDTGTGVKVEGPASSGNKVQGNYIGTDAAGEKEAPNVIGMSIIDAPGNLIGGAEEGARNVVSGSYFDGIRVHGASAVGNEIKGNYIGTDKDGEAAIPNVSATGVAGSAIEILAPKTVVGGTEEGAGNVISGNGNVSFSGRLAGFGIGVGGRDASNPEDFAGNIIQGNYIGTDATGTKDLGNMDCAVILSNATDTLLGGTGPGARNIISGNGKAGVQIDSPDASGNKVLGNFIGTDVSGDVAIGNDGTGVLVSGAPGNVVGEPGAGNVVSGGVSFGEGDGITIQSATGNSVQANFVGTDATGTKDLGNSRSGIAIVSASDNVIGGAGEGEGNVVSGNRLDGVAISNSDSTNNTVHGNFIGTDATGEAALPNEQAGLLLQAPGNTIGGAGDGEGNVISGNSQDGVYVRGDAATGNDILGNFIGTGPDGKSDVGNVRSGVRVVESAGSNTIGDDGAGSANIIAFNDRSGVSTSEDAGGGNAVLRNSIFENSDLGIDLDGDGVTANDAKDSDSGPNGLQNFPVIGEVSTASGGDTRVSGSLNGAPGEKFVLRFFASEAADSSGYGEGKTFVGQRTVTTNPSGEASFDFALSGTVAPGGYVAATATSATGDASEFSKTVEAVKGEADNEPEPGNPNACTIRGTNGDEVLRGTAKRDVICGLGGDDLIRGMGGDDGIRGGSGDDAIHGGAGNDTLIGGKGRDVLEGEAGNDRLNARDGVRANDIANGGPGRDECAADKGDVKKSCP